ncbi:tripartite tricarboxylate transporter TctB family protein [Paraburkholderia franconis]|uniref:tripartite tricarboxylate transporter TctB family protein n=1 Tax=Paraburkholderia franconis TaxID=2654983 RepID=UPI002AB07907|nr:tripartite tricarboxylate transporter TctB family protein [Paraburkholderia franconis]
MRTKSLLLRINKDYYGGALLLVIGMYVTLVGRTYERGTLNQMGPGFFPVVLGLLLSVLGIIVALGARRGSTDSTEEKEHNDAPRTADWRGWLCIIFSIVAFVVFSQYFGFIPASFATVFISAMGDRENTWKSAFVLAVLATVFGVIVFEYALKIQLPMIAFGG